MPHLQRTVGQLLEHSALCAMRRCRYEARWVGDDEAVMIGVTERPSGPPSPMYACHDCAAALNILPLIEHPAGSDGRPIRRDGAPVIEIDRAAS
jgi:hypothetical protein